MKPRKGAPGRGGKAADKLDRHPGAGGQRLAPPTGEATAQARAGTALRAIQGQHQALIQTLPLATVTIGRDERVQTWNSAAERLFGWMAEEIIGEPLPIVPPDRLADFHANFANALRGAQRDGLEVRCLRKDGSPIETSLWTVPLLDDAGVITGVIALFADITDRKQTEAALRESEAQARRLAQEDAIMAEVGRIIGSTLRIEEVYESFAAEVQKVLPFDRIVINSINAERNAVQNLYIAGEGLQDRNTADVYPLEGSGNAEMVRTRNSLLLQTDDFQAYADRFPALVSTFQAGFRSILNVPLFAKGQVVGGLLLRSRQPQAYTDRNVRLAERIGAQIAGAVANAQLHLENVRLYDAARRRAQQLATLNDLTRVLMTELDSHAVLQAILGAVQTLIPDAGCRLFERDKAAGVFRLAASIGLRQSEGGIRTQFRPGEGIVGAAVASRQPMIIPDVTQDPRVVNREWAASEGMVACIALPLLHAGQVAGALAIFTRLPHSFSDEEISLLQSFGAQAAIAIENARLFEAVRRQATELEDRVRRRTAELEAALRVKAEFLAVMSHELRTPLNAVLGFSEVLLGRGPGDLTPKQERFLEQIRGSGMRLLDLVTDILDLTQVEGHGIALKLEAIALGPLFQEVLQTVKAPVDEKRLTLRTALDPDLSHVVADRGKLTQILLKLLQNALKFTPAGGAIRVTARRILDAEGRGEDAPRQLVEIAVEDTGIGLAPADLERIFSPFQQVDGSDTRAFGGAGVGLTLVRTLVGLHGGRVWAESAGLGTGARFVVRLPVLQAPPPRRVLVADDEAVTLKPLCIFLRDAGYAVEGVTTGAEALAAVGAAPPDLLILDIGLPDLDGWEILRRVRAQASTAGLPVLVLTGLGQAEAEQAEALGATEFLTKPFSFGLLTKIVRDLLAGGRRHPIRPPGGAAR